MGLLTDIVIYFTGGLCIMVAAICISGVFGADYEQYNDSVVCPGYAGADGHSIELINNLNATNPTYKQAMDFIADDTTNYTPYNDSAFTCGDYAEKVHNNAESAGYTCGWVAIDFEDGAESHACNVFNTTDRGLIYVDCTQFDTTVDFRVGTSYIPNGGKFDNYESMGTVSEYKTWW